MAALWVVRTWAYFIWRGRTEGRVGWLHVCEDSKASEKIPMAELGLKGVEPCLKLAQRDTHFQMEMSKQHWHLRPKTWPTSAFLPNVSLQFRHSPGGAGWRALNYAPAAPEGLMVSRPRCRPPVGVQGRAQVPHVRWPCLSVCPCVQILAKRLTETSH